MSIFVAIVGVACILPDSLWSPLWRHNICAQDRSSANRATSASASADSLSVYNYPFNKVEQYLHVLSRGDAGSEIGVLGNGHFRQVCRVIFGFTKTSPPQKKWNAHRVETSIMGHHLEKPIESIKHIR